MGWLESFGGRKEYELTIHTGDTDFYAACIPNKGKYYWNMKSYGDYKTDEAVTIYIAAHEAGHCYDKQFNRFGDYKPTCLWSAILLISLILLFICFLGKGIVGDFGCIMWLFNGCLAIFVLSNNDILITPMEIEAERFAMKYLGPGMVLHGQLKLASISYERTKKEKIRRFTPFGCRAYLMSIEECLKELGIDYMEEK